MKMMKKNILLAATLGLTLGLGACSDDDIANGGAAAEGDEIKFTAGLRDSRTIYQDAVSKTDSEWQLLWQYGKDTVRVFSQQTEEKQADYVINPYSSGSGETGFQGRLDNGVTGQTPLKWTKGLNDQGLHHFYSVYPASKAHDIQVAKYITYETDNQEAAIFKCPFSYDQKVTVASTATDGTDTDGQASKSYKSTPDTKAQYMFANIEGERKTMLYHNFYYHPVMTTLDVVITNKTNQKTATIMGLTVKAKLPKQMASDGYFYYRVYSNQNWSTQPPYGNGLCNDKGYLYSATANEQGWCWTDAEKETTNVEFTATVSGGNQNGAVDLASGESVTLTVFLPPIDYTGLEFRVNGHNTGDITATIKSTIPASDKKKTRVTADPSKQKNNWITFIDDDVYVQQLSIPGSNEAISYLLGSSATQTVSGKTQIKTFEEQLNLGIRAFDVHIQRQSGSSYNLYAGSSLRDKTLVNYNGTNYDGTLNNLLLYVIKPWLDENTGEFVLLSLKSENNVSELCDAIDNIGSDYMVEWRKDLTVKDCRGKVVYVVRNEGNGQNDYDNFGKYPGRMTDSYDECTVKEGGILGIGAINRPFSSTTLFVGNANNKTDQTTLYYFAKNSGSYYQSANNGQTRLGYITSMLSTMKNVASQGSFPWGICYIAGSDANSSYINNAANQHPLFYNWIQTQSSFGALGIIFMDYVGERTAGTVNVSCDLLPAAIINNNYRFKMNRKPATTSSSTTGN